MTNIEYVAKTIMEKPTEFQGEDGFLDKGFIMFNFGLNKKDWTDLILFISKTYGPGAI